VIVKPDNEQDLAHYGLPRHEKKTFIGKNVLFYVQTPLNLLKPTSYVQQQV
jgi:hypothetical protein